MGTEAPPALSILAKIEANTWIAKKEGDTKFIGISNQAFWSMLGQNGGRGRQIVSWVMHCGNKAIAFSAHVETVDTVYLITGSYDDQWKAYSPGSILLYEVLIEACTRGKRVVDWGQGDSGYKSRWGVTPGSRIKNVMVFRPGLMGRLLFNLARLVLQDWDSRIEGETKESEPIVAVFESPGRIGMNRSSRNNRGMRINP